MKLAGRFTALVNLPQIIAAAVLVTGAILMLAQLSLGALAHGKQMKLCADVYGVHRPVKVAFTIENILDTSYQHALAARIGFSEPFFPLAVRLRNQVEFSIFDVSATPSVVVGRHGELLERAYIDDYCTRDIHRFMATAPGWAAKIRTMQDQVEGRGQTFIYALTTSKVAQYPEYLPAGIECPSSIQDRTGLLPAWLNLVRHNRIHIADAATAIAAARAIYPISLYPEGGTHWNQLGSAIAAQTIEAALHAQRRDGSFAPFTFSWVPSRRPVDSDVDLTFLMNLLWINNDFIVPIVTMRQAPKPLNCRRLRITIVGGSFMLRIIPAFVALPCGADVTLYFYWSMHRSIWLHGVETRTPVDPVTRDHDLLNADVIIYEENEQLLNQSRHGAAFYQWVMSHKKAAAF